VVVDPEQIRELKQAPQAVIRHLAVLLQTEVVEVEHLQLKQIPLVDLVVVLAVLAHEQALHLQTKEV
jgi:hypothetical protein